jgi:AcrR family transcriptional regulator
MLKLEKLESLVAALAAGKTIREAAAEAQVSKRTVYNRLADPEFKARVMETRAAALARATGKLLAGLNVACDVLFALLENGDARVQQRAAAKLIELAVKLNVVSEIETRIELLERFVGFQVSTGREDSHVEAHQPIGQARPEA